MSASVSQSRPVAAEALPAQARFHLPDPEATARAGARLAGALRGGLLVTLAGELGTGKTTLVRGALRALGWAGPVKSPTYTLVEHYIVSNLYFYHFDLYRLNDPDEWTSAGFREYLSDSAVAIVEWPERAGDYLASPDLAVTLAYAPGGPDLGREIALVAFTAGGRACLEAMLPDGSLAPSA